MSVPNFSDYNKNPKNFILYIPIVIMFTIVPILYYQIINDAKVRIREQNEYCDTLNIIKDRRIVQLETQTLLLSSQLYSSDSINKLLIKELYNKIK